MRIFLAFAREACAFGTKSQDPAWSPGELDRRCRDFLLSVVIDAWMDKAKDLGIRKMFSSPHNWGYSLDDDVRQKIEGSPEWKQYQDLLRGTFDIQSVRAVDGGSPEPEQAGSTPPTTDDAGASSGDRTPEQPGSSAIGVPLVAGMTKQERRRAVVAPILRKKQWTVHKWGTEAGVGKNCPYEYLGGKRNLKKANWLALAQVLGLRTQDLPS